jgi:methylthioribulose-1-phosphate dehydratase
MRPMSSGKSKKADPKKLAAELAETGRAFHARAWALGTSGNYSAVLRDKPLRLLITSSSVDKAYLSKKHFLQIDDHANILSGDGRPSAESLLHVAVARARGARCILHTHSVWSTILSDRHAKRKSMAISGYEMLKGLEGVKTHEHQEWIPIFENSQDIPALAKEIEALLKQDSRPHGFLLRGHGLYTWGEDVEQARRHVEIFEFLLELVGRRELAEHGGMTEGLSLRKILS